MSNPSPLIDTDSQRPFVLLPSGAVIDLASPDPQSWTDEDLAIGLSRTFRWGGHSGWPHPLSVAQHSLSVLAIRQADEAVLEGGEALFELLHDGEEGLLGFDCIAPLKAFLGNPFAALCQKLTAAIAARYQLQDMRPEQYRRHKAADTLAAASEALHVARWTPGDIRSVLKIATAPLMSDPLVTGPFAPWEPWPSDYAAKRWLDALNQHRDRRIAHRTQPAVLS